MSNTPLAVPDALPIDQADPKPWWRSRGVVGAAVVVLASVVRLAAPSLEIDTQALTDAILDLLTLAGGALAWWGRVRASQPIRRRPALAAAGQPAERLRRAGLPPNRHRPAAGPDAHDPAAGGDEFWRAGGHGPFLDD